MGELFDAAFLEKIQKLALRSQIVLNDGALGNRKSRSKGSSVEFSDFREYAEGDDFRRIDWNAYGRFEKLFIKLYMEEREAPVHIFLDTSKSMDWGNPNKTIASRRLAAALGFMSLTHYDRVSLVCVSDRVESSRYSLRGKNVLGELLAHLENIRYQNPSDMFAAVKESGLKASRGISILISDFLFPQDILSGLLHYLRFRKQELYVCHLLAPQEVHPEVETDLRLVDSETGRYEDVTATARLLKVYSGVFAEYIRSVEETCMKRGARYIRATSDMEIEKIIKMVVGEG